MKYETVSGNGRTIHYAICYRCEKRLKHCGSRAQKYCLDCKKVVDRENARKRMRRYRARQKEVSHGKREKD